MADQIRLLQAVGPFCQGTVASAGLYVIFSNSICVGDYMPLIFFALIYKGMVLAAGCAFLFLGYKLFLAGFDRASGSIGVGGGKSDFKMEKVAPGVFFALFGAVIIGITVYKGIGDSQHGMVMSPNTAMTAESTYESIDMAPAPGGDDKNSSISSGRPPEGKN